MKIAILADSLALPRQKDAGDTPLEATYPFLLQKRLQRTLANDDVIVIERGLRRRTIENVIDDWFEIVALREPEVVVVHVGIVDCAPRVFLRNERDFVERLRPFRLRSRILNFAHEHRRGIVAFRKKVYVSAERFAAGVDRVVELARETRVRALILVNIVSPPAEMENRSPGFLKNVETYNQILENAVKEPWIKLVDLNQIINEHGGSGTLTVDGIHLNHEGHKLLASELETRMSDVL